jgi:hypothetical protein
MFRKSLATLPPTLDAKYERILCAIDESDSQYATRILQWLAFSRRPLKIEEVSELVAINPKGNPAFEPDEVLEDPWEVLNICSSLVSIYTVDEHKEWYDYQSAGEVVLSAHYSAKEYLISERCPQSQAKLLQYEA